VIDLIRESRCRNADIGLVSRTAYLYWKSRDKEVAGDTAVLQLATWIGLEVCCASYLLLQSSISGVWGGVYPSLQRQLQRSPKQRPLLVQGR
jgi:hypothetical protein